MDEDDLVSYRQYTINTTGTNRGRKRPAPPASPPPRTTTNAFDQEFDMEDDHASINPEQHMSNNHRHTAIGDTTYTVTSQQSIIGLQQSEDIMADMTDDEDEEN